MKVRRLLLSFALTCLGLAGLGGSAAANDLATLDADPASNGSVVVDPAGSAYIAWLSDAPSGSDVPRFCRIAPGGACAPIALPVPGGTISDSPSGAFPVLGPGSTVYVVAPRHAVNDVVFWTSTDGGASFGAPVERDFYASRTSPTDVFLQGGSFLIGAYNPGLGFSTADIATATGGALQFSEPGPAASSSMGLDGTNPVIAYWNIVSPPYPLSFYRYKGAGSLTAQANWEGPVQVTNGYEPALAGGAGGLYMASQDYAGGQYPSAINLRRFEGTAFGPPRTLVNDSSTNLFVGGAIAQSPGGNRLAVAWPGKRAGDDARVMRLFSSADGGLTFSESHVSRIGDAYAINANADMATNDAGIGWLVYRDAGGLKLADLNPIAGLPPSEKRPPIYKGKTKEIVKKAGAFFIVLRLPKSCLQSRQRFFMGVGKRKRRQLVKKLGGGTLRFTKVVFIYDGKKLKVKKKKPFRYLVDPGPLAPGSVHRAKARVTAVLTQGERERKIKRVIKGTVRAC